MTKPKKMDHKEELRIVEKELGLSEVTIMSNESDEKIVVEETNQVVLTCGRVIPFNTDIMTGRKIIQLKDKYFLDRKRNAGVIADLDDYFYVMVAEEMTGIKLKEFMDLKAKNFRTIVNFVRNFLTED